MIFRFSAEYGGSRPTPLLPNTISLSGKTEKVYSDDLTNNGSEGRWGLQSG